MEPKEPKPESRIENPLVAQILAEKEHWHRNNAIELSEAAKEDYPVFTPEGDVYFEKEEDPLYNQLMKQARKQKRIARFKSKVWQKILSQVVEQNNPLPLTNHERDTLFEFELKKDKDGKIDSGVSASQEYQDLKKRYYLYDIPDDIADRLAEEVSWATIYHPKVKERIDRVRESFVAGKLNSSNPEVWDALLEMYEEIYGVETGVLESETEVEEE